MRFISAGIALAVSLAACSPANQATIQADVVKAGQLFCKIRTVSGPIVVTLLDAAGVPVIVTGMASNVVAAWCQQLAADAVPVVPAAGVVAAVAVPALAPAPMAPPVPVPGAAAAPKS